MPEKEWSEAVVRRSRHEPLQYILGSQPFGPLDISCRKGVLIPRWETEEWCKKLTDVLGQEYANKSLRIVDACTGTGCIPLLIEHNLRLQQVVTDITGFDIAQEAYDLAKENSQKQDLTSVVFKKADLLQDDLMEALNISEIDLITSNPPYIPFSDYNSPLHANGIQKSVRQYEPQLALVGENEFYVAMVKNLIIPSRAKGFILELGYQEQADCIRDLLDGDWDVGTYDDSAGNLRCVVGWKKEMAVLQKICN